MIHKVKATLTPEQCPCGRARAGCEYHDLRAVRDVDEPASSPPPVEYSEWRTVVCGPGVFVLDDQGEEIEMPVGATLSFQLK